MGAQACGVQTGRASEQGVGASWVHIPPVEVWGVPLLRQAQPP